MTLPRMTDGLDDGRRHPKRQGSRSFRNSESRAIRYVQAGIRLAPRCAASSPRPALSAPPRGGDLNVTQFPDSHAVPYGGVGYASVHTTTVLHCRKFNELTLILGLLSLLVATPANLFIAIISDAIAYGDYGGLPGEDSPVPPPMRPAVIAACFSCVTGLLGVTVPWFLPRTERGLSARQFLCVLAVLGLFSMVVAFIISSGTTTIN